MSEFSLLFLGTSAYDFSPLLDTVYKDKFDHNARRASSMLVNGHTLIDCGLHVIDSLRLAGVPLSDIDEIFVTHFHPDHFSEDSVKKIALATDRKKPLTVFVRHDVPSEKIAFISTLPLAFTIKMPRHEAVITSDGALVTAVHANHDESTYPQHFLFEKGDKKFLYATDGGWFLTNTYNFLKGKKIGLAAIDCTCGDHVGDYRMSEHNSIPMLRLMLPSLRTAEILDENATVLITHLAPSLHKPHAETVNLLLKDNIGVAYDGLTIEY